MSHMLRNALAAGLATALALAAGPAAALGLGQIHVKSRPGQPLLAEIPIITSDPAELQGLQVQLASPETFRRIGLEPPQGDVTALRFEPAIDEQGRPVIRITSPAPVQQPLLTFLVAVDWSGGRLVREYSALADSPRTVAAPSQPAIEAPVVAPPNTIQAPTAAAEPAHAAAAAPAAHPATPKTAPAAQATHAPAPAAPANPVAHAPAPAAAAPGAPRDVHHVQRGDTLSRIAAELGAGQGYNLDQAMVAMLRANPGAFIGGNINKLKAGAVLRVPSAEQVASLDAAQAAAIVHEQIAGWRAERQALRQPADAAPPAAAAAAGKRVAAAGTAAAGADARLEIVPPSGGAQAGSRSGIEAGGEGEMLRQQLQETKESLAARDAEVQELRARVAELEKLQQDQQQLLQMKDGALAAAQQNLRKANEVAAQPAQAPPAPPAQAQPHGGGFWLWGGAVLLGAAFVAWLLARRRRVPAAPAARRFDTAALAASLPTTAAAEDAGDGSLEEETVQATVPSARGAAAEPLPSWHAGSHAPSPPPPARPPSEQLDLAQAYLDVGDEEAARALLREVLDSRDPAARESAARLLRDL